MFVFIRTDRDGFVRTGPDIAPPTTTPLATSRAGVFAAGDVRAGSTKRVAAAVGAGSQAVSQVHHHLTNT